MRSSVEEDDGRAWDGGEDCGFYIHETPEGYMVPVISVDDLSTKQGNDIADWFNELASNARQGLYSEVCASALDDPAEMLAMDAELAAELGVEKFGSYDGTVVRNPEPAVEEDEDESCDEEDDLDGVCAYRLFQEDVASDIVAELGAWPTWRQVCADKYEAFLRPVEHLREFFVTDYGDATHLDLVGDVSAWDVMTLVKMAVAQNVDCDFFEKTVGGRNRPPDLPMNVEAVIGRTAAVAGLVGTVALSTKDAALVAQRCYQSHDGSSTCFERVIGSILGRDLVSGCSSVADLKARSAFARACAANGDPIVGVCRHEGSVHMFEAREFDPGESGVLWYGPLSEVPEFGGLKLCWVDRGIVRGFPGLSDGRMYCDLCECVVVAKNHAQRCRPTVDWGPPAHAEAWIGDALHVLDVREALLKFGAMDVVASLQTDYTSARAQTDWLKAHGMYQLGSESKNSTWFEANYPKFRDQYKLWLAERFGICGSKRYSIGSDDSEQTVVGCDDGALDELRCRGDECNSGHVTRDKQEAIDSESDGDEFFDLPDDEEELRCTVKDCPSCMCGSIWRDKRKYLLHMAKHGLNVGDQIGMRTMVAVWFKDKDGRSGLRCPVTGCRKSATVWRHWPNLEEHCRKVHEVQVMVQ
jgi:uncharacterized C2H2 Zn-finger protein